jgi:hypothetical protein
VLTRRKHSAKKRLTESESAAIAQTQLRLIFTNDDEESPYQADRSNELLRHQDPNDQSWRRRA